MMQWQPIETARSDNEDGSGCVLLCDGFGNRWVDVPPGHSPFGRGPAVCWQHLPSPPQPPAKSAGFKSAKESKDVATD